MYYISEQMHSAASLVCASIFKSKIYRCCCGVMLGTGMAAVETVTIPWKLSSGERQFTVGNEALEAVWELLYRSQVQ